MTNSLRRYPALFVGAKSLSQRHTLSYGASASPLDESVSLKPAHRRREQPSRALSQRQPVGQLQIDSHFGGIDPKAG